MYFYHQTKVQHVTKNLSESLGHIQDSVLLLKIFTHIKFPKSVWVLKGLKEWRKAGAGQNTSLIPVLSYEVEIKQ